MALTRFRLGRVLRSRRLATVLFMVICGFAVLTTVIPQESLAPADIPAWRAEHPTAATIAEALGLHRAFRSPLFLVPALLLTLGTALCAWDRSRALGVYLSAPRGASLSLQRRLTRSPTTSILLAEGVEVDEAVANGADVLRGLGLRVAVTADGARGYSMTGAAIGSALFHWALVGLFVTGMLGQLIKWEAQIEVPVGHSVVDGADYYSALLAGPLAPSSPASGYRIEIPALELDYSYRGIDRDHAPKVRLYDGTKLAAESFVYPNSPLRRGGLYVHRGKWGLAVVAALETTQGVEVGRRTFLFDIGSTEGTGRLTRTEDMPPETGVGQVRFDVPLDPAVGGRFVGDLPKDPRVEVEAIGSGDASVTVMRAGDVTSFDSGGLRLRVVDVTRYVQLRLVHDPSIWLVYLFLALATVGSVLALMVRPRVVLLQVSQDGAVLRVDALVVAKRIDSIFRKQVADAISRMNPERGEGCS